MAGKMVKISDFAKQFGISDRHARRLVAENESDLSGHYEKRGSGGTWIDEVAAEILRGKLRNPQEYVQLTIDEADQAALQQQVIDLQARLLEAYKAVADERDVRAGLLLELGKQQLLAARTESEKERADRAEERAAQAQEAARTAEDIAQIAAQEAERAKAETAELQKKIETLKNRSLWSRIWNREV